MFFRKAILFLLMQTIFAGIPLVASERESLLVSDTPTSALFFNHAKKIFGSMVYGLPLAVIGTAAASLTVRLWLTLVDVSRLTKRSDQKVIEDAYNGMSLGLLWVDGVNQLKERYAAHLALVQESTSSPVARDTLRKRILFECTSLAKCLFYVSLGRSALLYQKFLLFNRQELIKKRNDSAALEKISAVIKEVDEIVTSFNLLVDFIEQMPEYIARHTSSASFSLFAQKKSP